MQALCVFRDLCQCSLCPGTKENTLEWPSCISTSELAMGCCSHTGICCLEFCYSTKNLEQSWFQSSFFWFNILSPFILCYVQWGRAGLCLWNQEVRGCNQEWFLFKETENHAFWDVWNFEILWLTGNQLLCLLYSSSWTKLWGNCILQYY